MPRTLAELTWPAHTKRLTIRPATAEDGPANWTWRSLPAVCEWIPSLPTDRAVYLEKYAEPDRLDVTLVIELDGVVIGDIMLRVEDAWAQVEVADQARGVQAELGWSIDPEYGGRGYATEAVNEAIRICFEELGLRRVVANTFADNAPSWRLMERVGMRRELHAVRESLHRSGRWLDGYSYALLADEWPAAESKAVEQGA